MPPNRTMIRMIGLGKIEASAISPAKPANHIHGAIAAIALPPSSGTTGSRLNRFRKKPVNASARHRSFPVACQMKMHAAEPMLPRIGPASPTRASASGVVAERLRGDHRAEERDEHRRTRPDALATELDHVTHLVHQQQHHEADRELEPPDRRVRRDRDEHRARRRQQLQLREEDQDRLELREERDDRRDRGAEGPPDPVGLAGLERGSELVAAVVGRGRRAKSERLRGGRLRPTARGRLRFRCRRAEPRIVGCHRVVIVASGRGLSPRTYDLLRFPANGGGG